MHHTLLLLLGEYRGYGTIVSIDQDFLLIVLRIASKLSNRVDKVRLAAIMLLPLIAAQASQERLRAATAD